MALFTTVIVVAVLKLAQQVFIPLALAILCTFLLAPMVELLTRWHVRRFLAVILSLTLGLAFIGGLATLVFNQFADLSHELPSYQQQLRANVAHLGGALKGGVARTTRAFEELTKEIDRVAPSEPKPRGVTKVQVVEAPATALETIRNVVGLVVRPVATTLAVIVLVAFMLLRPRRQTILEHINEWVDERLEMLTPGQSPPAAHRRGRNPHRRHFRGVFRTSGSARCVRGVRRARGPR